MLDIFYNFCGHPQGSSLFLHGCSCPQGKPIGMVLYNLWCLVEWPNYWTPTYCGSGLEWVKSDALPPHPPPPIKTYCTWKSFVRSIKKHQQIKTNKQTNNKNITNKHIYKFSKLVKPDCNGMDINKCLSLA